MGRTGTAAPVQMAAVRQGTDRRAIGIVGAGRFGSYLAAQLTCVGYEVQSADVRTDAATYEQDLVRACRASTVIYAVPIRAFEQAILDTRAYLAPQSVVMDVCSVKMVPCAMLERHLPGRPIVGTHPLFGRESAPLTCAGQRVAVCVPESVKGTALGNVASTRATELFTTLGLTIVPCTAADHDLQIARSQFLTHFIGRGAERSGVGRVALSTKSHDDLMDIIDVVCHDSIELFEDMAKFNPMTTSVRAEFLGALQAIDQQLREREGESC
jgi:prephenate dehydrogenase